MQFNLAERLMLGTVDWQRPAWIQGYYPDDLPVEWRLAYYANDCECVVLNAEAWCRVDPDALDEVLGEAPGHLVYFLRWPTGAAAADCPNLALFVGRPSVLLTAPGDAIDCPIPQWRAQGPDAWVDERSGVRLECWPLDEFNLRDLRARAESLDRKTAAIVLDGPAATPAQIGELRTLLQLMGRA